MDFVSLADVMDEMLAREGKPTSLEIVEHYYTRLREQRYCHKTLLEVFNEISSSQHVPKWLLSNWMEEHYPTACNLWMARKKMAVQLALLSLTEHAFHLTAANLGGLTMDLNTAQLYASDYRFDLNRKTCESIGGRMPYSE